MHVESSAEKILEKLREEIPEGTFVEVRKSKPSMARGTSRRQASVVRPPAGIHYGRLSVETVDQLEREGHLRRDRSLEKTVLYQRIEGVERRALRLTSKAARGGRNT